MSALNTFFNFQTAVNTRATSRSSATTARGVQQMASADRLRELRERGWIKPSSTPAEVMAVEETLAAQMRARIELSEGRPQPFAKISTIGTVGAIVLLVMSLTATMNPAANPVPFLVFAWVGFATGIGIAVVRVRGREDRRSRALARAVVKKGRCRWCKQEAPHVLEGEDTEPRVYHALEIEREIAGGRR